METRRHSWLTFSGADCGFKHSFASLFFAFGSHADDGCGEADGCDDRLPGGANGGADTNTAHDGFLAVAGDAGAACFGEVVKEACAVNDGVLGAAREAVDFDDLLGHGPILEGGDCLAERAAVRGQHASDAVGHADLVKGFDGVEDMDAVLVKIGHAGGFIEALSEALQLGADFVAQRVGLLDKPAEAQLGSELVGSIHRLAEEAVFFKREQNAEERGFRKACAFADLFEGQGRFAVETVEDVKRAADGTQIILLVG